MSNSANPYTFDIAVIGGGPSGLMAAEAAAAKGLSVAVFERMPTPARKFLMAGKSGLNITHGEKYSDFVRRYCSHLQAHASYLDSFTPSDIQTWMKELGIEPFVGSSGRVFPAMFKASPLLRAWLKRLAESGVSLHTRHNWTGWNEVGQLCFDTETGHRTVDAKATVLALGGASWPKLGSNGDWCPLISKSGVDIEPMTAANCGLNIGWSDHFSRKFGGEPLKNITASVYVGQNPTSNPVPGDLVVTNYGLEGTPVYTLASTIGGHLRVSEPVTLVLDLAPDRSVESLIEKLSKQRGKRSLSNHLRKTIGLTGAKAAVLRESINGKQLPEAPENLADLIKRLPISVSSLRPIEEAISSAGGLKFDAMDKTLMLKRKPGVFCTGEMLDWDAPTGGYLLTACLALGRAAGANAACWALEN